MNLYPDEPTFTLRAADKTSVLAVLGWAREMVKDPYVTRAQFVKAAEAAGVAERMLQWQLDNPDKVKLPD